MRIEASLSTVINGKQFQEDILNTLHDDFLTIPLSKVGLVSSTQENLPLKIMRDLEEHFHCEPHKILIWYYQTVWKISYNFVIQIIFCFTNIAFAH